MKFLFSALLKDGTVIQQTHEDVSQTTVGKNAFFDVIQRLSEVAAFVLLNTENNDSYAVNLIDGHFEVNQVPFFLHNELVQNIRLIFFKRNTINFTTREVLPVQHIFGFQCNLVETGENRKFLMTVI